MAVIGSRRIVSRHKTETRRRIGPVHIAAWKVFHMRLLAVAGVEVVVEVVADCILPVAHRPVGHTLVEIVEVAESTVGIAAIECMGPVTNRLTDAMKTAAGRASWYWAV